MQEHRLFKGATRPPMFIGVPLVPVVLLGMVTVLPMGWLIAFRLYYAALVMLLVFLGAFVWMRMVTKKDAWRTKQEIMRMRMRRNKGNEQIWGGVSYAPFVLKVRR